MNGPRQTNKRSFGIFCLAIYGFFCMFGHFSLHGLRADCWRHLYLQFEGEPAASMFRWALETRSTLNLGLAVGALCGFVVALLFYLIIRVATGRQELKKEYEGNQIPLIGGTSVFALFLIIFFLAFFFVYPQSLKSSVDVLLGLFYATICFWSAYWFLNYLRCYKERRDFLPDKDAQLKKFEVESDWARETLHFMIWAFLMVIIGGYLVALYDYFFAVPLEIRSIPEFGLGVLTVMLQVGIIAVGFYAGVIYQQTINMKDILFAIREYAKHEWPVEPTTY